MLKRSSSAGGDDGGRTGGAAGLDATYRETPVPHTIDAAWLPDLRHQIGMALRLD